MFDGSLRSKWSSLVVDFNKRKTLELNPQAQWSSRSLQCKQCRERWANTHEHFQYSLHIFFRDFLSHSRLTQFGLLLFTRYYPLRVLTLIRSWVTSLTALVHLKIVTAELLPITTLVKACPTLNHGPMHTLGTALITWLVSVVSWLFNSQIVAIATQCRGFRHQGC